MFGNTRARARARDAFDVMCRLYGDAHVAQALMRMRGACDAHVARLALAMRASPSAVKAAMGYGRLESLPWGYGRLMAAAGTDGRVAAVLRASGGMRRFTPWEIHTAVKVVLVINSL